MYGPLTRRARRRWLPVWTAVGSALILAVSAGLQAFFGQLNGNITTESMAILGKTPPPSKAGVLNILALGSQTRDGQGPGFGRDPGTDLSDTAMLIHLNADHTHAIVVSIPRDLIVNRPACRERVGGDAIVPGSPSAMFDSAMNLGGPACAIATVENISGLRIDHFVRLDFNGFRRMTNVLGGVQVCVPRPGIHDWRSHLNISAGLHVITGNQALAFVRDRHGIGNGGDLGRIEMQQMFVSSLLRKVLAAGTLTDPMVMYKLANVATGSLTTDPGLDSVQKLLHLGQSLRGLQLGNVTFVTLPNQMDPTNLDRLMPKEPQTSQLWQLLRSDHPWPAHSPSASGVAPQRAVVSISNSVASNSATPSDGPGGPGVQARNASENICSGLPKPNDLGRLGQ